MLENPHLLELPGLQLIHKVGEGGMSSVWKAVDLVHDRIVAVKFLHDDLTTSADDLEQFKAEERAMETIDHEGVVKGYALNHANGLWYYVMEFVDGYNFGALLKRKQHLPEVDCLLICESVAAALDYAWNQYGVVHCDIKPDNIMINTDGVVKLTDLGLCHTFRYLQDGRQEAPEHVLGTPAYISPEQIYGDVELDCRADIYSLAATLYHLATGRVLFPGLGTEDMMRAQCDESKQAKDPRLYHPGLSASFCRMLEVMLVKDRDYRLPTWADVFEMCHDVEQGVAFKPRSSPGVSTLALAD